MTVPKLRIEVLGGFEITLEVEGKKIAFENRPPNTAKYRLLAYLVSQGGGASRANVLKDLFYGVSQSSRVRLQQTLTELREELGRLSGRTDSEDQDLYLRKNSPGNIELSEHCSTDVAEFVKCCRAAYPPVATEERRASLQRAVGLYRGPLLLTYEKLNRRHSREDQDPEEGEEPIPVPVSRADLGWLLVRRAELDQMAVRAAGSLRTLEAAASSAPVSADATGFPVTLLHNLEKQEAEPCLGRSEEKEEIKRLIARYPLVKIIGAGGCGKTCLALEVARELERAAEFDVVWVLELAQSRDEAECVRQISRQMGRKGQESLESLEDLLDLVVRALGDRRLLLVLDNCEHLIEVSLALIKGLRREQTRILVTSQFDPYAEGKRYVVAPLPLPDMNLLPSAEALVATNAAVEFFQTVAQMNQDDFAVDEQNKALVARLCHAVDGLPLAIRLVASHIRVCGLEEMLAELTELLLSEAEALEALDKRHGTMTQCVGWAYRTLSEEEKMLLCRLSLFRGGMLRSRFEEVFGFEPLQPTGVRSLLNVLVSKSLVSYEPGTGRCRQLEPIRQFAEQQLDRIGQREEMEKRLVLWIEEITEGVGDRMYIGREGDGSSVETAIAELFTIDSAATSIEPAKPEKAGEMRVSAMVLRFAEGRVSEGNRTIEALRKVVRRLPKNLPRTADLQLWLYIGEAVFTFLQSKYEETARAATLGLELAQALKIPAPDRIAVACCGLGMANTFLDDPDKLAQAIVQIEEGARIARSITPENHWCIALSHMCRGAWLWQSKCRSEAIVEYDLALEGFQHRAKNRLLATFVLNSLAHLHCRTGNIDRAVQQYLESIQTKNVRTIAGCVLGTCGIATAVGCLEEATFFYGAASRHYAEIGAKLIPPVQADYTEEEKEMRRGCGDRYQPLYDLGATLSLPDARLLAQIFLKCCLEGSTARFLTEVPEKHGLRQKLERVFRQA